MKTKFNIFAFLFMAILIGSSCNDWLDVKPQSQMENDDMFSSEKGFKDAEVTIMEKPDPTQKNQVILSIAVDKKEKIKVNSLDFIGNEAIKDSKLAWTMKKTNERGKLINLFRTKKFVMDNYEEDKKSIIEKYHELGYRDAEILWDTVYNHDDKSVNIEIKIDEGEKYYIRNIK